MVVGQWQATQIHTVKNSALYPIVFAHSQMKWPKYPCMS